MRVDQLAHAGRCGTHKNYHLTCEQYESIRARSANRCDVCRAPASNAIGHGLFLDHDHLLGWLAVRGILCPGCNNKVGAVDAGRRAIDPRTAAYLAAPWHETVGMKRYECPTTCRTALHARARYYTPLDGRRSAS